MIESTAEYHRRRAAEEMTEAELHANDITAQYHKRLAAEHFVLAREAEAAERKRTAELDSIVSAPHQGDDDQNARLRSRRGDPDFQGSCTA